MPLNLTASIVRVLSVCALAGNAFAQNQPPAAPLITEPIVGRIVNPSDLHMETGPFSDPNAGDTHRCTDWEVWTVTPSERIWITACITGVERVHTHLGDGTFENSHAGRRTLFPETNYVIRVRHRDSSNIPATEWSAWSERPFVTGAGATVFPLDISDVLNIPAPSLRTADGSALLLRGGSTPATIRLETGSGQLLLEMRGPANAVTNPPPLAEHDPMRVTVSAGSGDLSLPPSDLRFTEDSGEELTLYLPTITLSAGASVTFWIASNGATYFAGPGQTTPDFSSLARGATVPWTTLPGFAVDKVAGGFQLPVDIEFVPAPAPDADAPLFYVAELYGTIKVVLRNGEVRDYATGLLNYNPTGNFPGSGEQGLGGIAVDPRSGNVWATLLYSDNPADENAPHHPVVERFTSTDGGRSAATRTRMLDMAPEAQGQSHQVSNISFGPDGLVYVHVGDGFDAAAAQNLNFFRGKIIRMLLNGQPSSLNPFYNAGNGITAQDYIFARGLRNPFGGAWRLSDASHYVVENGPSIDRFSKLVRARNYGYDGSDASMTNFALYNWAPATAPVRIAFPQAAVFGGSGFPANLLDRAYVTLSGGTFASGPGSPLTKSIQEFVIDSTGTLVGTPRSVAFYNGGGASSVAAIAAGPDGLYFSDLYEESGVNPIARGANILRLRSVPIPPPPDCNNNGIPDGDEIANGTVPDCNANGVPDSCDIIAGVSQDCNANDIPDDCDVLITTLYNLNTGPAPFQLNGNAQWVAGAVRLTTTAGGQLGTMVRPPLSATPTDHFRVSFDFRIGQGTGADGMCFAVFNANLYSNSVLFGEEGPGSTNENPAGTGTLVLKFDTYNNRGEGNNTIEIAQNGVPLARFTPAFSLVDNQTRRATITFAADALTVTVQNGTSVVTAFDRVSVPGFVPFVARYGFGGRTGGLTNEHWVDNIAFEETNPLVDADGDGVPDSCACPCVADFDASGGTPDSNDIDAFFTQWLTGNATADADCSGGTPDAADIDTFFTQWLTGGC
jgi:glucose/arabinose dehydrogenase